MATLAPELPPAQPTPPIPAADGPPPVLELDQRAGSRSVVASQWQLMYWRFTRHKLAVLTNGLSATRTGYCMVSLRSSIPLARAAVT